MRLLHAKVAGPLLLLLAGCGEEATTPPPASNPAPTPAPVQAQSSPASKKDALAPGKTAGFKTMP